MAGEDATLATKDGNKENQACNRGDIKATREGEETSLLDLKGRGDDKDGTKNDHRRGTDNLAKETGLQEAMGGSEDGDSEDGGREQS